jgi:glycosyltransferase involved in cell wall biosynthesis
MSGHERTPAVLLAVGGRLSPAVRRAIAAGERPRLDVLELEARYGARLLDYSTLTGTVARLAGRTGLWSEAVALRTAARLPRGAVVYATGEDIGFPLALALRVLHRDDVRLVMRLENPLYGHTGLRRTAFVALAGAALARVDRVLCRTGAHQQLLTSFFRLPPDRVDLVLDPTDLRFWGCPEPRAETPVGVGHRYVLAAGLEMRDYATLIAAACELDVEVVIAAGSPWSHNAFAGGPASLPANVRVASYSPVELRALYHAATCVVVPVLPTLRSSGCSVVLETWAARRPLVAAATVGLRDYVEDGKTGLFYRPGDARELAARIQRVLADETLAARLAHNGHCVVRARHDLDRIVEQIAATLIG